MIEQASCDLASRKTKT